MLRRSVLVACVTLLPSCGESTSVGQRGAPPVAQETTLDASEPAAERSDPRPEVRVRDEQCRDRPEACVRLGVTLTRTDLARAASLFESACAAGSVAGCANFAVMLLDGRGIEAQPSRGRDLLRRACEDGHDRSCRNLAALASL